MSKATKDQELLEKLIRGGRTNLSEWFEKITDKFYEEQAMEERILAVLPPFTHLGHMA